MTAHLRRVAALLALLVAISNPAAAARRADCQACGPKIAACKTLTAEFGALGKHCARAVRRQCRLMGAEACTTTTPTTSSTTTTFAPSTCPFDLARCFADLERVRSDLTACTSERTSCEADLEECLDACPACHPGVVLETGQTRCWDHWGRPIDCTGTGHDGELQRGLTHDLVDNGDGTITDARTGLMWEKLSADGGIHDASTLYVWHDAFTVKLAALNTGAGFAGHNDWRLPNLFELQTLLKLGGGAPATWPEFETACATACSVLDCSCTGARPYWSSSTYIFRSSEWQAWHVDFETGVTFHEPKKAGWQKSVRAVRNAALPLTTGRSVPAWKVAGVPLPVDVRSRSMSRARAGRADCRRACPDRIASCEVATTAFGTLRRRCADAVRRQCMREGVAACASNSTTTTTTTTTLWSDTCRNDLLICRHRLSVEAPPLVACDADRATCRDDLESCRTGCPACPSPGVLKTGQTQCWDTDGAPIDCVGTGQDGELQRGLPHSYFDNGDGTITDRQTNLMWEKLSYDGGLHHAWNTYEWTEAIVSKIAALNAGSGFAGHTDWRLPNLFELATLVNLGAAGPAVWQPFNDYACAPPCTVLTCSCTASGRYWSSSAYERDPGRAWFVDFPDGGTAGLPKVGTPAFVRAVRAGL